MSHRDEYGQRVGRPVSWTPPAPLETLTVTGREVSIAPLEASHAPGLWEALGPDRSQWTYMGAEPPRCAADMSAIVEGYLATPGWLPHVLLDPEGDILGTASYLRIQPEIGSAEIGAIAEGRLPARTDLGRSVARMAGMHALSQNIAGALQRGEPADTAAALVKLLGTTTEGDLVDAVSDRLGDEFAPGEPGGASEELADLLRAGLHQRPGFTLRGGTNEILRGVIARGLGMR